LNGDVGCEVLTSLKLGGGPAATREGSDGVGAPNGGSGSSSKIYSSQPSVLVSVELVKDSDLSSVRNKFWEN